MHFLSQIIFISPLYSLPNLLASKSSASLAYSLFKKLIQRLSIYFKRIIMRRELFSVLILTYVYGLGEVGAQEPLSEDDILGAGDVSPPLSAEDGLTILGTGAVDVASTLSCHRRLYSYRVTKTDSAGRKCWGQVNVMSCWGRCDSNEIPDFRFPYKKSHHPVCIFGSKKPNVAVLDNCDEGVEPGTNSYEYQEAESCHCSVCKSSEASCEGMRYRGVRSGY